MATHKAVASGKHWRIFFGVDPARTTVEGDYGTPTLGKRRKRSAIAPQGKYGRYDHRIINHLANPKTLLVITCFKIGENGF